MAQDRLQKLGYTLTRNAVDAWGRKWRYRVSPIGSGPTNYFDTIQSIHKWATQVEAIRAFYNGDDHLDANPSQV